MHSSKREAPETEGWRLGRWILALVLGLCLGACGGGGSDAGTSVFESDDSSSSASASYAVAVAVQVNGTVVTSLAVSATAQLRATVTDAEGEPVAGVLVSFTDSLGLLGYSPAAATALTGTDGVASLDISPTATGATQVSATVSISDTDYESSTAIAITAAATEASVPAAIGFVSVTPSSQSIVIRGAGGNGRVETAILKFQVLDTTGAAVSGATINFSASPADAVTLNVTSAPTDSSGYVSTTVQSGSMATTVVITATSATVPTVSGKSDTLSISTGSIYQAGFGIYADTYNLDGTLVGDSTPLTAYLTDSNGNPVADGVAVSFTTDYGSVGSSSSGACTTSDGVCTVSFVVKPPFGNGLATVVATANDGSDSISSSLQINMAGVPGGLAAYTDAAAITNGTAPLTSYAMSGCAASLDLYLMDASGRSAAAGTAVAVASIFPSDIAAAIAYGNTVLDSPRFTPTLFTLEIDTTDSELAPCNPSGTVREAGYVRLSFTTPASGRVYSQRIMLSYPQ